MLTGWTCRRTDHACIWRDRSVQNALSRKGVLIDPTNTGKRLTPEEVPE